MTPRLAGLLRTGATLGVLALLLLFAVTRGLDAVSEPFPENAEPPVCVDTPVRAGDRLRTAAVTVSVINAGTETGLASRTLGELETAGFDPGQVSNLPDPDVRSAQIWTTDGRTPAVKLVRSYLGEDVKVVIRPSSVAGVTVVVGGRFTGVQEGRPEIRVRDDFTVCGPTSLSGPAPVG